MNASPVSVNPEGTQTVLGAVLREGHGVEARLEQWTAHPLIKRGKRRTVRYDLDARVAGEPDARHCQWVGKFYERDDDAERVARIMRELATSDCRAGGDLVIPRVLGYHAPWRLLLLTYEPGESVIAALGRQHALVLPALGRALAALHSTSVTVDGITSASGVLDGLRKRINDLGARFPDQTTSLRRIFHELECQTPGDPARPQFLHGDLGPAQLLWQMGRIVVLDFDRCTRGDPALDLGNLLTQLRRLTLRKPDKLPDFPLLRWGILDAYKCWAPQDSGFVERVAWYERVLLLRKIQFLASDTTRHKEADRMRQRQAEAIGLLEELPTLVEIS
jgi:hypothetical protein